MSAERLRAWKQKYRAITSIEENRPRNCEHRKKMQAIANIEKKVQANASIEEENPSHCVLRQASKPFQSFFFAKPLALRSNELNPVQAVAKTTPFFFSLLFFFSFFSLIFFLCVCFFLDPCFHLSLSVCFPKMSYCQCLL